MHGSQTLASLLWVCSLSLFLEMNAENGMAGFLMAHTNNSASSRSTVNETRQPAEIGLKQATVHSEKRLKVLCNFFWLLPLVSLWGKVCYTQVLFTLFTQCHHFMFSTQFCTELLCGYGNLYVVCIILEGFVSFLISNAANTNYSSAEKINKSFCFLTRITQTHLLPFAIHGWSGKKASGQHSD